MKEKVKVLDVKLTDGIKMVIDKYQNNALTRVWAFKALEQALAKYVTDTEADDIDPEFNFVWAITQLSGRRGRIRSVALRHRSMKGGLRPSFSL